ncbi:MAG: hypothetical protein ACHQHO_02565 [Solirubrobacterales bacterium]
MPAEITPTGAMPERQALTEDGSADGPATASPYSTGGGGTVLEHRYGAVLLAALLTGDPVPGLPSAFAATEVAFQAGHESRVDDFLLTGRTGEESARVSIAVRRDPNLVASNHAAVELVAALLTVVLENAAEVQAGRWMLALAVASPNQHATELRTLAERAHTQGSARAFHEHISRDGATTQGVRGRLEQLEKLIAAAVTDGRLDLHGHSVEEASWRMLSATRVIELRLQGTDESDRTTAVARLRRVLTDDSPEYADSLFDRLLDLSSSYAPAGAHVTVGMLRRDLLGVARLRPDSRFARAHELLAELAQRLKDRTGSNLTDGDSRLQLPREDARKRLESAIASLTADAPMLLVHGEPDVGKSALTVRCFASRRDAGASVTALSLADLPERTLELEAQLAGPLAEVLAASAVAEERLLIIDGAEGVLEGRGELFGDLAAAALSVGARVVAVTRSDAAGAVADALRRAGETLVVDSSEPTVHEHRVLPLSETEATEITRSFPSLARLEHEPRARWLLSRPGLIDLLLRSDAATALPDGALSEADVFAAIWHHLVRRREATSSGVTPDARENALVALARKQLLPDVTALPDASALPSLRSDGLLLPSAAASAWGPGDQFANDLVRDLALARLLVTENLKLLSRAGGPRWALRAAKLACQAALAHAQHETDRVRDELQDVFTELATEHGERWAELPLEALLTLGPAAESIERSWSALMADKGSELARLMRIALQRHTYHGVGDPGVLGPVVEVLCKHPDRLAGRYAHRGDLASQARELVLAWLLGVSNVGQSLPTRVQLRELVLAREEDINEEFAVNLLALLGPDLDVRAQELLRTVARESPGRLEPAVEADGCVPVLARHHPELLLDLTDAYYIDRSRDRSGLSGGVRDHTFHGVGTASAAAWRGPFWLLLAVDPAGALRTINRLLDHAATEQVRGHDPFSLHASAPEPTAPTGLELELAEGSRFCIGDERAWSWYRGSSVGPYPCMSALLAVESYADQCIGAGESIATVTARLLVDCRNLAMPGLVVGLLERHILVVDDELDRWLTRPEIWELEFSRATAEGTLHLQGPDPPHIVGRDRRRFNMGNAAGLLVAKALTEESHARLEKLKQLGEELLTNGVELFAAENVKDTATLAAWASQLDSENYTLTRHPDGQITIDFAPPQEITDPLRDTQADLYRGQQAWRLLTTYALEKTDPDPAHIATDLQVARELASDPPIHGPQDPTGAPAAVAAAALVAHAAGKITLDAEQATWAACLLLDRTHTPTHREREDEFQHNPMGADRAAAQGLPTLLLPDGAPAEIDTHTLKASLLACAQAQPDEVRHILGRALKPVWATPCDKRGKCRHEIALEIIQAMLIDCQLGPWESQSRQIRPLDGPAVEALAKIPTDDLLTNRLAAPIVATADASNGSACNVAAVTELHSALLDAYRRGAVHWAEAGYGGHFDGHHREPNRVLVAAAAAGDRVELERCLRAFASSASTLSQLLGDISAICTYDAQLRRALPELWPWLMGIALQEIGQTDTHSNRHAHEDLVASLIPHPTIDVADRDPDATLGAARSEWVDPELLTDHVPQWIAMSHGEPRAVDALVSLLETAPTAWQATTGLRWLDELIDTKYTLVASRCFLLPGFLERLRASDVLNQAARSRLQRLIDGLVAAGDQRAVHAQRAEE